MNILKICSILFFVVWGAVTALGQANPQDTSTWKVNPAEYDDNMIVTGLVKINGVESRDSNDIVAAFVGSECRGVARPVYLPALDSFIVTLFVYSDNAAAETVQFYLFSGKTNQVLPIQETLVFDNSVPVGSPDTPFIFNAIGIRITFNKGDVLCAADNQGFAAAKVTGGTPPYRYAWSNGSTRDSISGLTAGWYYLTVTDSRNFAKGDSVQILNLNRPIQKPILLAAPDTVVCEGTDVYFFAYSLETEKPKYYWYDVLNRPLDTSETYILRNIQANFLVYAQTEVRNCRSERSSLAIRVLPAPDARIRAVKTSGFINEEFVFTVVGTTPGATYSWLLDGTRKTGTRITHQFANAGVYEVQLTATSAAGCKNETSIFVTITALDPPGGGNDTTRQQLVLAFNVNDVLCQGDPSGSAGVLVFNGTPPFRYSWSNGSTAPTIRGVPAGTYRVTVTDADGRSANGVVSISSLLTRVDPPQVIVNSGQPICEGDQVLLVTVDAYDAAEYYWYDAPFGGNLVFQGDQVLLRNVRDNRTLFVETRLRGGCISALRTRVLVPVSQIDANFTTSATVAPRNFPIDFKANTIERPLTYHWNFGDGDTLTGPEVRHAFADAGIYEVSLTVKFPGSCEETVRKFIRITQEDERFRAVMNVTNVPCAPDRTGRIAVQLFNGTAPFTYRWSNGSTHSTLDSLPTGTYRVTITDAGNNSIVEEVRVESNNPAINIPTITVNGGSRTCIGSDVIAAALTNVSDAEFRWYNAATDGNLIYNGPSLQLQNIQQSRVLFVEAFYNGCTSPGRREVLIQAEGPDARFTASATTINEGIPLQFAVTAPALGNTYDWKFGDGTTANTPTVSHLFQTPGIYEVTLIVTNSNGCSQSRSLLLNVIPSQELAATFNITNVDCAEARNGAVTVNVFNGNAPYTFNWNTGASGNSLSGLGAGTYTVTITDNRGTTLVKEVEISSEVGVIVAPQVVINGDSVLCPNEFVNIYAFSSQVGSPSYYWFDAAQGGNLLAVNSIYSFYGRDLTTPLFVEARIGECRSQVRVPVRVTSEKPNLGFTASATTILEGDSVKFTPVRIDSNFTYQWFFDNGTTSNAVTPTVKFLTAGVYDVRLIVTNNATGCADSKIVSDYINVVSSTDLSLVLNVTNVSCSGDQNGAIAVEVFNGRQPYRFTWSNGATTPLIANLATGTYTLTFTDASGVSLTRSVRVSSANVKPSKPTIAVNGGNPICYRSNLTLLAASGEAVDAYKWYNASNEVVFTGANFAINGISASATYTLESVDNGCVSDRASVTLNVQTPNPAFAVNPGEIVEAGEPVTFVPAISTYPTYNWNFGNGSNSSQVSPQFIYNNPGDFKVTLTVTDANSCTNSDTFALKVTPENVLGVFFRVQNLNCANDTSASITAVPVDGAAPYTFRWSNGATTATIRGIAPGVYSVTITDGAGKTANGSTILSSNATPIAAPTVEVNGNAPVCLGSTAFLMGESVGFPDATLRWYRRAGDSTAVSSGRVLGVANIRGDTVVYVEAFQGGCVSARVAVPVRVQVPPGDFTVTPRRDLTEGDLVQFRLTNNNPLYQYFWEFGDGGWSGTPQPFYFYNVMGVFDVSLEITDEDGCTNLITKNDYITVRRMPGLTEEETEEREGNTSLQINGIQLAAFPNPFTTNLTAVVKVATPGNYRLTLVDLLGRTHWNQTLVLDANVVQSLDLGTQLPGLANGMYFLRIENDTVHTIYKLFKQNQ